MNETPLAATQRIVNLGDSITDGHTYPLLVSQALEEAGQPVPQFIGAGIGGDTSAGMLLRLDRDVLAHRPTLVMLNCGINDFARKMASSNFEANVIAIAERVQAAGAQLMILTTTAVRDTDEDTKLEDTRKTLRGVADKYRLPVAEVHARMEEARRAKRDLWEKDGCHLNFEGYRCVARAVLDAFGARAVPVPLKQRLRLMPGIIAEWKVLTVDAKTKPLDADRVAALKVDAQWQEYRLPEREPVPEWWRDQERQRGFSVALDRYCGKGRHYLVAQLPSVARKTFLNTGGDLSAVWLNGVKLDVHGDRGWHAGSNRLPVELKAGPNTIVVETGNSFFVSLSGAMP